MKMDNTIAIVQKRKIDLTFLDNEISDADLITVAAHTAAARKTVQLAGDLQRVSFVC